LISYVITYALGVASLGGVLAFLYRGFARGFSGRSA